MCGLAGSFGRSVDAGVHAQLHRGPDAQGVVSVGPLSLGHVRLSIIDPDSRSDQPFVRKGTTMVFAGEVWNYRTLRAELEGLGERFVTSGDTEVFAAALDRWGTTALSKVDGMFAVAWTRDGQAINLARDRFGEVPLHVSSAVPFTFATEMKALLAMGCPSLSLSSVRPGHVATATATTFSQVPYYTVPHVDPPSSTEEAGERVRTMLLEGTRRRALAADVPVCVLLSGGVDSTAVAWAMQGVVKGLTAYTAVMDRSSSDLRAAREAAYEMGMKLVEVVVQPPLPADLARTVRCIEMPYKAQVEIGWPCLALADRISRDGYKVVFSGEGSDELWGSYQFAYRALAAGADFREYRKSLFVSQERKNFARCNKVFLSRGVECRLPFLHPPLVELALSLPQEVAWNGRDQKAVMRSAFDGTLPKQVVKRQKVAFQDAIGMKKAAERTVSDPKRFYRAEFNRMLGEHRKGVSYV